MSRRPYFDLSNDGSFRAGGNATAGGSPQGEYVNFCDDESESPFAPSNMVIVSSE